MPDSEQAFQQKVILHVSNLLIATSAQSVFEVYLRNRRLATGLGVTGVSQDLDGSHGLTSAKDTEVPYGISY